MNEFEGKFEFFCKPTKSAKNKETIIELTGKYTHAEFCKVEKFWDEKVTFNIVREELKGKADPKVYGCTIVDNKHNKGAKDIKTFTIFLSKTFDHDEHLELDAFLHKPVFISWSKIQPDINFEKKPSVEKAEENKESGGF